METFPATLRFPQVLALYIGSVLGSGILILPGLAAEAAGPASLVAWGMMSLLVIPMALTMGLLSVRYPSAGGVSHFVTRAFGPGPGSLIGWLFLLSVVVGAPVLALTGAGYVCAAFGLGGPCRPAIAAVILLAALVSNYLGMRTTGRLQVAVVVTTIVILAAALAGSVTAVDPGNFAPFLPHGWGSVGHAMTLIFWCFIGWEAVSHLTAEFEDPGRDVVRGTLAAAVVVSLVYLATAVAVIGTRSYGPGVSDVSLVHLIRLSSGAWGGYLSGAAALFICVAPAIAYTGAASRLAYALSATGYAPTALSRLSRRYRTPAGGLGFLALAFGLVLLGFSSGLVSLPALIQLPNASFILTYLGGCGAGLVLLRGVRAGRFVSAVSLALTGVILLFAGWSVLYPVLIALAWSAFMLHRRRSGRPPLPEAEP